MATDRFTSNRSLCDHEHVQILFIGDIVGKPGRQCLRRTLPILMEQHGIDIVVANVENRGWRYGGHPRSCGVHPRYGCRCHDVGQPYLGQERGSQLHRS